MPILSLDRMRRTRLTWDGSKNNRRKREGYLPFLPNCWKDALDFSDPLRLQEDRTSFFCDLCKQQMSSKASFAAHCNSAFHKEKEGSLNKLVSEHEWICHTCEKPFPSKISLDQHCLLVRHQPIYRIEGMSGQKQEVKNEGQDQGEEGKPQDSGQEKKKLFSFESLKPPYYCEVCEVDCLNELKLKSHCESWRHRAAADKQEEGEEEEDKKRKGENAAVTDKEKTLKVDRKAGKSSMNLSNAVVKGGEHFCDICDVTSSCYENYLDHLNGKKHRKNVSSMKVPYCCIFCDCNFRTAEDFQDHYRSAEHISKASGLVDSAGKEMKMEVYVGKEEKFSEAKADKAKEIKCNEKRVKDRSREWSDERDKERGRGRSGEQKKIGRKDRSKDKYKESAMQKERYNRHSSGDGKKSKSGKRSRERDISSEESLSRSANKYKNIKNKGKKPKRQSKKDSSSSSEWSSSGRSSRSVSSERMYKSKSTKKKKEKYKEKTMKKGKKSKGSGDKDEIGNKDERKVEIKNIIDREGLGDLREKLNRGVNIVITKKVKNDNEEEKEDKDAKTSCDDDDSDLKKDEEKILKHHKADLVLREQLLKEHTLEILKYKDAEDEYKRLFLEEDYLRKRLDLFRDGDPRKDSDAADLSRIQRAIRDLHEELEIRDVMIQEKERYLIVLKNRIDERIKIIAKAEAESPKQKSEVPLKQNIQYIDSVSQKVAVKSNDNLPIKDTGESISNEAMNEDGDLRGEIERERILRKLAPGMAGLDFGIRKRIVDALLTSDIPRSELLKPAGDDGIKEEEYHTKRHGSRDSAGKAEEQDRSQNSLHVTGISSEDLYTKKEDEKPKVVSSYKTAGASLYQQEAATEQDDVYVRKGAVDSLIADGRRHPNEHDSARNPFEVDDFELEWRKRERELRRREEELRKRELELLDREKQRKMEGQGSQDKSVTLAGRKKRPLVASNSSSRSFVSEELATRKRSRSRSSSPIPAGRKDQKDDQGKAAKIDCVERSSFIKVKTPDDSWAAATRSEQKEFSKPTDFISQWYGAQTFGDLDSIQGVFSGMDTAQTISTNINYTSSALKEVKRLPENQAKNKEKSASSSRREQFALWKSVLPANEASNVADKNTEKVKEDIWDTAFGTGEEEPVDKVAIDIFSDLDVDSDYLKGKLHESRIKTLSKPSSSKVPMPYESKQITTQISTVGTSHHFHQSSYPTGSHIPLDKPPERSEISEQSLFNTGIQIKKEVLSGEDEKERLFQQNEKQVRQESWKPMSQREEKQAVDNKAVAKVLFIKIIVFHHLV